MRSDPAPSPCPLLLLFGANGAASLVQFAHNAESCDGYPKLPEWISRGSVYRAWLSLTAVGAIGLGFCRVAGLAIICLYAAMGLAGLLHYQLAPMYAHTAAIRPKGVLAGSGYSTDHRRAESPFQHSLLHFIQNPCPSVCIRG